ncbi:hypothetical protein [Methylophaga sp. OBS1]|uniref:hypothetical protein n=1 Tax=Methylophaga sp. OBS1 TaxID=2991933 RepID=UPI002255AC75|nr:hypothetical protein [Methylophaga sp. OBS1]MCX4193817.1 hypothetical protein [Methylophaga sp. OBS1]
MIKVCLIGKDTAKEKALLESQPGIALHVIATAETDVMLKAVCDIRPDILIVSDVGGQLSADELCMHTYLRAPDIKTLIITEHEADYARLEATGFSCKGFMLHQQRHAIVRAVRVMYDGEAWLSRKLVTTVLNQLASQHATSKTRPKLVNKR